MSRGASAAGVTGEEQTARWVRRMFGRVARRYDLLNHLLSLNMDRCWRRAAARRARPVLDRQGARALDICCGSGDLTLALSRAGKAAVYGSDFCRPMLTEADRKIRAARSGAVVFEADALRLPLPDGSMDLITVAFGFRNLANYRAGLDEMRRVLAPGGLVLILEFSTPPGRLFRALYDWYSRRVLPWIGGLLSGSREAYQYLPASVRCFPGAEELADDMEAAGFEQVEFRRLTGGIVALHSGVSPN